MWFWLIPGITLVAVILTVTRCNKMARTILESKLNIIGIQIGDHIYTPTSDIYTEIRLLDLVYLQARNDHIIGYRIFHRERFCIKLKHVPTGHHLIYKIDGQAQEHLYLEGTPFVVWDGDLILYQRKRKGMGFVLEEVGRSKEWPIEKTERTD